MLDSNNGFLTIETSDFGLQGTVLTIKLYKESITSMEDPGQFGEYIFDVTFEDQCTQDTVTATTILTDTRYDIGRGTLTLSP